MRTTPSSSSRSGAGAGASSAASNNVACNCKKSKCLKMYCDCFRLSEYCKASCNCVECCNIVRIRLAHAAPLLLSPSAHRPLCPQEKFEHVRLAARKAIQDRNPEAFKPRVKEEMKEHLTGCHCRKSACLKKYCECYTGKVPCSSRCRCVDCQNVPQLYAKSGGGALTAAKAAQVTDGAGGKATATSGGIAIDSSGPYAPKLSTLPVAAYDDGGGFLNAHSTSPSAAVAALTTLSATKVSSTALLDTTTAQPVTLFADDDDNEPLAHSQSSARLTSTGTTTSEAGSGGLSIEIPAGGNGKPPAVFHVTQSPELRDLARKGQQFRDAGSSSHAALDTLTSVQSAKPLGTFSAPQSPLRTTGGTISAVVSPKLLELAELCGPDDHDSSQPSQASSRIIAFPTRLLPLSQEDDDATSAPISRSGTSTSTNG